MSFYSDQNLTINSDIITSFDIIKRDEAVALRNSKGYQDFSTLATWVEQDPLKNMLTLETAWNKQDITRLSLFQDAVKHDAVLEVNGWEGEFHYKMPVETDTCMKTVEDTSDQAVDGGVGADGTPFRIVLNRELSPNTPISCDGVDGDTLIVSDLYPTTDLGYGFEHWVVFTPSLSDPDRTYDASLLESGREYFEMGNAYIAEYSEKLGKVHMPSGTNYITAKFKLGSGQGVETWFTGKANSVSLMPGYTTADTQAYINEINGMGGDVDNNVVAGVMKNTTTGKVSVTVGSLLEKLAIQKFNKNFNTSLMFMQGANISTSKGNLVFNEGLWRQMLRGFVHTYSMRGQFSFEDLRILRDYAFQGNPGMKAEDSILRMKMGSELYDNVEVLIQNEANRQVTALAPLLGSDRVLPVNPITGKLDSLEVALVKFGKVKVPGIGLVDPIRDTTMDYTKLTDRQLRGMNPGGKDFTTYSGIVWDVTDQMYSNNKQLPAGTKAVNDNTNANIYFVKPQGESIYWGRENGRYSQSRSSDILASAKTMHESFFMYGFGAMWVADASKFAMTQLEKSNRVGTR